MQQTRLDRWLKEKLTHETHVFCLSKPPYVPKKVKLENLEINLQNRFRYLMVIRNLRELEKTLQSLTDSNQTYKTKVLTRKVWYANLIDDPTGASLTYKFIWFVFFVVCIASFVIFFPWSLVYKLGDAFGFLKQYM